MTREIGVNREKIQGIWLLVSFGLLILFSTITPSSAAPIETSTTVLSNIGAAGSGDTIQFTIWVYSGFDPVPTGPIRITDTNTSDYIDTTILGGKATVNWTISGPISEGIHIFEAAYQGYLDYNPSSGVCSVKFDDFDPGVTRVTSITLDTNSTVVFKNASIHFTVELKIHFNWYFQGGYIYVKNTNLTGSPTIHTYGPLPGYFPGTDPAVMNYSFDYQIPIFTSVGTNSFIAEYTGSLDSGTLPCQSNPNNITVMSTGYWLTQNLNSNNLQREEDTLILNTSVLGDNPVGLELLSYYSYQGTKVTISDQIISSRNIAVNFSPNSSVPVGTLSIFTELIEPSTKFLYANSTKQVLIIDRARIDHSENATEYRHNETIQLEIYITEEDVHTHPVMSKVELIDITDGNRSLTNKTTNQNGFVIIEYSIPDNSTVGSHEFLLRTHCSNTSIIDVTKTLFITIKGITEISLIYDSGGVDRNTNIIIEVTVLSGGLIISEGLVSLEFAINNSVIATQNCVPGVEFQYFIDPSHPCGVTSYQIRFFNSPNYDEQTRVFDITVFSYPIFNTTGKNTSSVIKGTTVRIWGQLMDEIGIPLTYETIELTDITIGTFLGTAVTDHQGIFYYDYCISVSTQIGIHLVEIVYSGNIAKFFHPSINTPIVNFVVRPPLSVMIDTEVVANHWAIISLEGGQNDVIYLEWQKNGDTIWNYIDSVVLNSTGQGEYNWTTSYYKGDLTIRAVGPNSTKYDHTSMYSIPDLRVSGDVTGSINDPCSFTVNSSEQYQIWIEGQLWQDWQQAGIHQYSNIFTNRGNKEIKIVSNATYVYYNELSYNITIYEEVIVDISAPIETIVNMTVNIDGTVIGEVSGPIQGIDAILEVNGTDLQIDSTNGAGHYYFSVLFDTPGYYSIIVKTPLVQQDFYSAAFSYEVILLIKSVPADIQIKNPINKTYGAFVEVSITGDAMNYWYRIDPLDSVNISWTTPVYRNLAEGNYICHVYGKNAYGVITYVNSSFTVDTTAPSLVLISPGNISYTNNDILLSYLTDETQVYVFLDGLELFGVTSGMYLTGLSEGSHNLTITTKDQANNSVTRIAIFIVDTIPPSLEILSPYNQSYTGLINVSISSNGSSVFYFISGVFPHNQTYTNPVLLNLSIGHYTLEVYAFDDAGNVKSKIVSFSVVQTISLLVNPGYDVVDGAGNYLIYTQILANPNLDTAGVYLNGTYAGSLQWSIIHSEYQLPLQLNTPGLWEVILFANTTLEEYDFHHFQIIWYPPPPEFESIAVYVSLPYFDIRVQIDSGSLPLDSVQVFYNSILYDLTYQSFGNRWICNLPFSPKNDTLLFYVSYPWDDTPSAQQSQDIYWFAPTIVIENFVPRRENFTTEIRVEKQNASIYTQSMTLKIYNGTMEFVVVGSLIYESLSGSFQQWLFTSPNLPHKLWNYSFIIADVHGSQGKLNGTFDTTDLPPYFGNESVFPINSYTNGELWRIEVPVHDDYNVDKVLLYVNGVEYTTITQNTTHFIFEVWLIEGVHNLQLVAFDDINQVTTLVLPSITVSLDQHTIPPNTPDNTTSESDISSGVNLSEDGEINDLIELGFAGSIFAGLVAVGNFVSKRRGL